MKITIIVLSFLFLSEFFLQGYHILFQSNFFFRHTYEQSKGIAYGEDYDFHLNSQGFKDIEFEEKKEDLYRILTIGDSFAFGSVPYQNTFLTLTEKMLQQTTPGVELLNMGLPSLPPQEYFSLLGIEGVEVQPDMLLLSFFIGDDFSSSKPKGLFDGSALISLGKKILDQRKTYPGKIYHRGKYCDTCPVLPKDLFLTIETEKSYLFEKNNKRFAGQFENALYSLRKIRNLCEKEDIQLLVVIIPDVVQINTSLEQQVRDNLSPALTDNSWDISQPNRALANWLTSEKIDFLDLYPVLKNSPVPIYKTNDVHWNLAGNKLAAEILYSRLLRYNYSLSQLNLQGYISTTD